MTVLTSLVLKGQIKHPNSAIQEKVNIIMANKASSSECLSKADLPPGLEQKLH